MCQCVLLASTSKHTTRAEDKQGITFNSICRFAEILFKFFLHYLFQLQLNFACCPSHYFLTPEYLSSAIQPMASNPPSPHWCCIQAYLRVVSALPPSLFSLSSHFSFHSCQSQCSTITFAFHISISMHCMNCFYIGENFIANAGFESFDDTFFNEFPSNASQHVLLKVSF